VALFLLYDGNYWDCGCRRETRGGLRFCSTLECEPAPVFHPDERSRFSSNTAPPATVLLDTSPRQSRFLGRFTVGFLFSRSSRLSSSSLDTLSTWRIALSNRSNSVLPGTSGGGRGFIGGGSPCSFALCSCCQVPKVIPLIYAKILKT
jgi:hypothetical protein